MFEAVLDAEHPLTPVPLALCNRKSLLHPITSPAGHSPIVVPVLINFCKNKERKDLFQPHVWVLVFKDNAASAQHISFARALPRNEAGCAAASEPPCSWELFWGQRGAQGLRCPHKFLQFSCCFYLVVLVSSHHCHTLAVTSEDRDLLLRGMALPPWMPSH